ncbi:hypothetical protein GCM10010191_46200 [Actinomadura vinacea]|uniref:VOC domain-containing protein n=1 Tax=Actinomadura vinacea TaxID=115336 RepID=A0ABN3JGL3_9ACTN
MAQVDQRVTGTEFDHTSFAVRDMAYWVRRLRRDLGATPIAGEVLPEFRYLLFHVGDERAGARLELMDARGDGFLTRFLARHGDAPHHLTFIVSDLAATVERARRQGLAVVNDDLGHPPWREAFLAPDAIHGVVVQLAQTTRRFPGDAELLASRDRDASRYPSNRGAADPCWWTSVWDEAPLRTATLGPTVLHSVDLGASASLFGDLLGGSVRRDGDDELRISWGRRSLVVRAGSPPGVAHVEAEGGPPAGLAIGRVLIGADR